MNVVPLSPTPRDELQPLFDTLAQLIESGVVSSFAIAVVHSDMSIETGWTKATPMGPLLGAIARLEHRINCQMDDMG